MQLPTGSRRAFYEHPTSRGPKQPKSRRRGIAECRGSAHFRPRWPLGSLYRRGPSPGQLASDDFFVNLPAVLVKQALRLFIVTSSRMNSNIKSGGKLVKDNINRDTNPFCVRPLLEEITRGNARSCVHDRCSSARETLLFKITLLFSMVKAAPSRLRSGNLRTSIREF